MTTKAKAKKTALVVNPAKKPAEATAALNIKLIKVGEVGTDETGEAYLRITANNAGGFFSKEWVSWKAIYSACNGHSEITSLLFRGLFRGKSINTAGFLLASLMQEGLIERKGGKSQLYILTEEAQKQAPTASYPYFAGISSPLLPSAPTPITT